MFLFCYFALLDSTYRENDRAISGPCRRLWAVKAGGSDGGQITDEVEGGGRDQQRL